MKIISTEKNRKLVIEDESKNRLIAHYLDSDFKELRTTFNGNSIAIKSSSEKVIIVKNGKVRGEIKFNPEGTVALTLLDKINNDKEWQILTKATWIRTYYTLMNAENELIFNIQVVPSFFKNDYSYNLNLIDNKIANIDLIELVFYSCFISRQLQFQ